MNFHPLSHTVHPLQSVYSPSANVLIIQTSARNVAWYVFKCAVICHCFLCYRSLSCHVSVLSHRLIDVMQLPLLKVLFVRMLVRMLLITTACRKT